MSLTFSQMEQWYVKSVKTKAGRKKNKGNGNHQSHNVKSVLNMKTKDSLLELDEPEPEQTNNMVQTDGSVTDVEKSETSGSLNIIHVKNYYKKILQNTTDENKYYQK